MARTRGGSDVAQAAMARSTLTLDEGWKASRTALVTTDVVASIAGEGVWGALLAMQKSYLGRLAAQRRSCNGKARSGSELELSEAKSI